MLLPMERGYFSSMLRGIVFALIACFFWGLIFVVPQFLQSYSSIEIALGRYSFYAVISLAIFARATWKGSCRYPRSIWIKSLYFSLASTMVYYTALVLALRCCAPAICALVLGTSPITIAFYGNWKERECSFKSLILPSLFILIGLVMINVPQIQGTESLSSYFLGLFCCLISLGAWSWYVVANSKFLRENPSVASNDWATMIGVSTLFWVALSTLIFSWTGHFHVEKYMQWSPELSRYLIGCSVLGLFCSWLGGFLWNKSSHHLPVSLAGQLTIFETIFGLLFVYTLAQELPPLVESIGIFILLGAVGYGIRTFSKLTPTIA